jgi:anti-sigma regulatory factor (Ser/Thr protein kinase)
MMGSHNSNLPDSPLINGKVKGKPKTILAEGIVKRLTLSQPLDVAIARTTVRNLTNDVGYCLIDQLRIASAIFELANYIVTFAGQGEIVISWYEDNHHKGLEFFCNDQGIHAPKLTNFFKNEITDGSEGAFSMASPQKLVDTFEFTEDPKLGNCINISIWLD